MIEFYAELIKSDGTIERIPLNDEGLGANVIAFSYVKKEERYVCCVRFTPNKDVVGYAIVSQIATPLRFDKSQFFAPACWYGSISRMSKFSLKGNIAGGGVDALGAPLIAVFDDNRGYYLVDRTDGKRETAEGDYDAEQEKVMLSPDFKLPGLYVENTDGKVVLSHRYPAWTPSFRGASASINRFLNAEHATFSFAFGQTSADSFEAFYKELWRREFVSRKKNEEGINYVEAEQTTIDYACRSIGERNGLLQFCVNTDHYIPESGFLYRNTDLAALLLRYLNDGYSLSVKKEDLIRIIDIQVENGYAGKKQFWPFDRSRFEGVLAVLDAYSLLKEKGEEKSEWLEFVREETEDAFTKDEYFSVPLLCRMYRMFGEEKYLQEAKRKCDLVWDTKFSQGLFCGGIVDFAGDPPLDKESGFLGLEAFLSVYELTGEKKYLNRAVYCADYMETFHQLQDINLEPIGFDDTKNANACAYGNAHVSTQGLGFIDNTCASADIIEILSIGAYLKLAEATGDTHYREYAEMMYQNAWLTVHLDDKVSGMADWLYGSGYGFTNEYLCMTISYDPNGRGRGMMHDSNIAWCVYSLLRASYDARLGGLEISTGSAERYKKIAVKEVDVSKAVFPKENIVDGNANTLFDVSDGAAIVMHFHREENVDKIVLSFENPNKRYAYEIFVLTEKGEEKLLSASHNHGFTSVHFINRKTTALKLVFEKGENSYLKDVSIFGVTKNALANPKKGSVTFVEKYIKGEVKFFADGEQVPFDNWSNGYLTENAELLKGRLVRLNGGRTGRIECCMPDGETLLWMRRYRFEDTGAEISYTVSLNGKEIRTGQLLGQEEYVCVHGAGMLSVEWKTKAKTTVEFGLCSSKING